MREYLQTGAKVLFEVETDEKKTFENARLLDTRNISRKCIFIILRALTSTTGTFHPVFTLLKCTISESIHDKKRREIVRRCCLQFHKNILNYDFNM